MNILDALNHNENRPLFTSDETNADALKVMRELEARTEGLLVSIE